MAQDILRPSRRQFVLGASALAFASASLATTEDRDIHSVAILSLLSEEPSYMMIGVTVFNNKAMPIKMEGKAAQSVESALQERLRAARPEWLIKPLADTGAIRERLAGKPGLALKIQTDIGRIEDLLPDLATRSDVDALIVVAGQYDDFLGRAGSGVAARRGSPELSSAVKTQLISRSGKELATGYGHFVEKMKTARWPDMPDDVARAIGAAVAGAAADMGY